MRRRTWIGALVAACALVSGCASIPTEGPVQVGAGDSTVDEDLYPIPPQIQENDAGRLVMGFIAASASGVVGDFSKERTYLTGDVRTEWDPFASITVYGSGDITSDWDENAQTITLSLPLVATVDRLGRLTEYKGGTRITVVFEVVETLPGHWRISGLDDGIILSEASFSLVFRPVDLVFASHDGVIVPDLRWLPRKNTATYATLALIGGPQSWLADAVLTGLKPTAELTVTAVPVSDGIAEVVLGEGSTGGGAERSLALEQISHTLLALPDVTDVDVTVGGLPIGGDGSVSLAAAPVPPAQAVVFLGDRFGVWDGEGIAVVEGGGRIPSGSRDIAVSYDGQRIAFVVDEGELMVASVPSGLVPVEGAEPATEDLDLTVMFVGESLVAPSFDRIGWLWTAEADGEGLLHYAGPEGQLGNLSVPGMEGRDIGGIAVSHDGVRIAVLSREGGVWRLGVAGIVRDEDGVPLSVGTPQDFGVGIGPSEGLIWVDERIVAVLGSTEGEEGSSISLVTLGGRTEEISALPDAVDVTARNGVASLVLITSDGSLYVRVNTQWSRVDPGALISSLAYCG